MALPVPELATCCCVGFSVLRGHADIVEFLLAKGMRVSVSIASLNQLVQRKLCSAQHRVSFPGISPLFRSRSQSAGQLWRNSSARGDRGWERRRGLGPATWMPGPFLEKPRRGNGCRPGTLSGTSGADRGNESCHTLKGTPESCSSMELHSSVRITLRRHASAHFTGISFDHARFWRRRSIKTRANSKLFDRLSGRRA